MEVVFRTPAAIPRRLLGDPLRLGQILINLGTNAVKFTEHGEVVVGVRQVRPESAEAPGVLAFDVRDTGIGLTEDQLGKLFQAFVQADASTSRKYGGTGLGLGLCRMLVSEMGGRIEVRSTPGRGATFRVLLAAAHVKLKVEEAAEAAAAEARPVFADAIREMTIADAFEIPQVHDLVPYGEWVVEAALGQTLIERHLAAFIAVDGHTRTGFLTFDTTATHLALARARATAHAKSGFGRTGAFSVIGTGFAAQAP